MSKNITLIILLLANFCLGQRPTELVTTSIASGLAEILLPKGVSTQYHNGLIVVNSDTIKSQVKFAGRRIYYMSGTDRKFFKLKKVTSIRIFTADSLITKKEFMDFIPLGKHSGLMYRKIYSGSFEIFDATYYTNEVPGYIGDDLIILDEGKIIQDINSSTFAKKYMTKYVNKKFNKEFETSDFNRKVDVINWLKLNDSKYTNK